MKLTQYSDYGIRVLTYLGLEPQQQATVGEIATAFDISRNHLMKVVQQLAAQGFVESRRGKMGGLRLARSAQDIGVGEVIRALENDFDLVECMRDRRDCRIAPVCRFSQLVAEANLAFMAVLDRYTLLDLLQDTGRRQELRTLLSPDQPMSSDAG